MKYIKYLLTIIISFIFLLNVKANTINKIDMDVYIDNEGNAHITEVWDANLSNGTEGYRPYTGMENKVISNFTVSDESGRNYEVLERWNTGASFSGKAYKCGYNYISGGVELCFGISEYGHKIYTLKYDISNFVTQYTDTQGIYFRFIHFDFSIDDVKIKVHSDTPFSLDNSRIWAFGYNGKDVFEDGNIMMYSDGTLYSSEYMTLLVRFESNIFNTSNKSDKSFDDIHDEAFADIPDNERPDYNDNSNSFKNMAFLEKIGYIISFIFSIILNPVVIFIAIAYFFARKKGFSSTKYEYENKKYINEKDIMYYREIPCNKDLEYAYFLCKNYDLVTDKNLKKGLMGAIILKWIKNKYITVTKTKGGLFNLKDNNYALDFTNMTSADNDFEKRLFDMMTSAAGINKILEPKEFEKWSKNNYTKIDSWYSYIQSNKESQMISKGLIVKTETEKPGFLGIKTKTTTKTLTSKLKEEAEHLVGFKKFLLDFSIMPEREYKEVIVWEEYLIFANLLGIADKVSEQFSKIYPKFNEEASFDVDTSRMVAMSFVNTSFKGYERGVAASRDYSGGSSWGGGGGSSFSGGGSSSGGSSGGGFR